MIEPTDWMPIMALAAAQGIGYKTLYLWCARCRTIDGCRVIRQAPTDAQREALGLTLRTRFVYRVVATEERDTDRANRSITQEDVDRIHRLHVDGITIDGIALAVALNFSRVRHVLLTRDPSPSLELGFVCQWCGVKVGANRVRRVTRHPGSGEYRFCPDCHVKLWKTENISHVKENFPGIY